MRERWRPGASTTRYYLSLDGLKNAGDTLLTGSRAVPGLAAGASQFGDDHGDDPREHAGRTPTCCSPVPTT